MARKKKPRITRTPEEHRLYVESLDQQQRERSLAGQSTKPKQRKRKPKQKPVTKDRIYEVERFARE